MGEMKSAWEIAQEKTEKLGKLSAEEQRKQKEKRCVMIGKALAEKYLGGLDTQYLEIELNRCSNEDKELIEQTILSRLVDGIDLEADLALEKIYKGISILTATERTAQFLPKIKELFQEYGEAELSKKEEIERAGREILHQMRISGTAIDQINSQAKEEWRQSIDKIAQPFKERLHSLKQELLR